MSTQKFNFITTYAMHTRAKREYRIGIRSFSERSRPIFPVRYRLDRGFVRER